MGAAIPGALRAAATGSCATLTKPAARIITAAIIHRIAAVNRAALKPGTVAAGYAALYEPLVVGGPRAAPPPGTVATAHAAGLFRHAAAAQPVARQALIAAAVSVNGSDRRPAVAVYQ